MSAKVDCTVYDCMYNCTGLCASNEIDICGEDATEVDSTCCATFNKGQLTNSVAEQVDNGTSIGCEVYNCEYNEDQACNLPEIQVDT